MHGNLLPTITNNGTAIDFLTTNGVRVIRYDTLLVTDAVGRGLTARFELLSPASASTLSEVLILVDATDARYPITIDPLATSPAWTAESNQAGADFGIEVGMAGAR